MSSRDLVRAVPDLPLAEPAISVDALFDVPAPRVSRAGTGRVRHDEKITVYVSADELHDLDLTRLGLGREHGIKVDRGRLVREAVAMMLAEYDERGPDSTVVRRLSAR